MLTEDQLHDLITALQSTTRFPGNIDEAKAIFERMSLLGYEVVKKAAAK